MEPRSKKPLTALGVTKAKYVPLYSKGEKGAGKLLPNRLPHKDGLFLSISPQGTKSYRWDFRYPPGASGKRQCITYGTTIELSLKDAEQKHIDARRLYAEGKNPAAEKKAAKAKVKEKAATSFSLVANEWYEAALAKKKRSAAWKSNYRRWVDQACEKFREKPMADIQPSDILALIKPVAKDGHPATAEYIRQTVSRIFKFAVGRVPYRYNPAEDVRGAIIVPDKKHRPKLERDQIGPFIRKVKESNEDEAVKIGMMLLLNTFPRRSELVGMPWTEVREHEFVVPAARMKKAREHIVPMSPQVRVMFARLKELAGDSVWVFPSPRNPRKHRTMATFNEALYRLGYRGIFSPHGVRATAASILADQGFSKDVVDSQLAHSHDKNDTLSAYFRNTFVEQRRAMLERWSQLLDGFEAGGAQVIPIGAGRAA